MRAEDSREDGANGDGPRAMVGVERAEKADGGGRDARATRGR